MTWGLQQRDYPILSPGQMNPFNQAVSSGLDTYKNMISNAYLQKKMQADIASKAAYATYSPYSYMGKALSDPLTFSALASDPEKFKAFIGKFAGMPTNPLESLDQFNNNGSPNSGAWNTLKENLGLNQGNQNAASIPDPIPPTAQQADNYLNNNSQAQKELAQTGETVVGGNTAPTNYDEVAGTPNSSVNNNPNIGNTPVTPPIVAPVTTSTAPTPTIGKSSNPYQSLIDAAVAKGLPNSPQGITLNTAKTGAETAEKLRQEQLVDMNKDAYAEGKDSQLINNYAEEFHNAYKNATIKGGFYNLPGAKKLAEFDPDAVEAMNSSNNIVIGRAGQLFPGKQSDARIALVENSKLRINMPEKAEEHAYAMQSATATRLNEHLPFNLEATKLGYQTKAQIDDLWLKYQHEKNFFDPKNGKIIEKNVGSYPEWLKEQAYRKQAAAAPTAKKPSTNYQQERRQDNVPVTEHNGKKYYMSNGKWREVS